MTRPSGEIGKRTALKTQRTPVLAGSTPASATMYGPYERRYKNGSIRRQVILIFNGRKTSMSYARWLLSVNLGRWLEPHEDADHIDENPLNDSLDNLQVLTKPANIRKSSLGRSSPLKGTEKGWQHGTMYGWMKKKCQCDPCAIAKKQHREIKNANRRSGPARAPYSNNPEHGTTARYSRGCKCPLCKSANADKERGRRQRVP